MVDKVSLQQQPTPQGVAGLCTKSRYGDKDNGDLKREDNMDSNNNRGSADSMCKDANPINHGNQIQTGDTFLAINSVRLRPKETTPKPKSAATPLGESMLVNSGIQMVNTPKGAPTPLGEPLPVNVGNVMVNVQANKIPADVHSRA